MMRIMVRTKGEDDAEGKVYFVKNKARARIRAREIAENHRK